MIQKFVHCQNPVNRTTIFEQTIETVVGVEINTIEIVQLKNSNVTNAERREHFARVCKSQYQPKKDNRLVKNVSDGADKHDQFIGRIANVCDSKPIAVVNINSQPVNSVLILVPTSPLYRSRTWKFLT